MTGRVVRAETRAEFLKMLRIPMFTAPTIFFPVVFYVLFGLTFGAGRSAGPVSLAAYLAATYAVFGVMGASMLGIGVGIAVERGQGWLTVKRASPMPPGAYVAAKVATAIAFSAIILLAIFALAAAFGGMRLPAARWAALAGVLLVGAIPFCALGCALGFLSGPNAAPAIGNLVHLPMAFASGLWIPLEALPEAVRGIAPFLPPYHLARIALGAVNGSWSGVAGHALALVAFGAAFALLALAAYRRDEAATYG